ncbi:MAG: MFS transporter [Ilumatobacteraceae bacterium]
MLTDGATSVVPTDPSGRWRQLTVLAVAMVLSMTTWFSASAVLPQLRGEWRLSSTTASWLTIAVQLGFVAGAVLSATFNLADRVAPRRLVLVGSLGAALANLVLLAADGPALALPARFVTGAFLALVYPPALKAMATWFRSGRGMALGVMVGALTLGSAMPHFVNGVGGARWELVVIVTSLATAVGGLMAEFMTSDGPFPFERGVFKPQQVGLTARHSGVRLASLGYFGHMWELYAMWAWFSSFFADTLVLKGRTVDAITVSIVTFAVIGVGAFGCALGGVLGDRWGRTPTTAAAMAISGACALSIGWIRHGPIWLTVVVGLVWGVTVVADSAQFSAMVTEVADQAYVGTAVTLQLAAGFVLTVATIWLVPVMRDAVGWNWAFVLLVPGPIVGVVAMLRLRASPYATQIAGGRG